MHNQRAPSDTRVCAVVVSYFPDADFENRLKILLPQVDTLVIVDNTPEQSARPKLKSFTNDQDHLSMIEVKKNAGVAAALNLGLKHALEKGCTWLLTLDQDTHCYSDMVETLLEARNACHLKPAVVGGNYLDPRNSKLKIRDPVPEKWLEQKTVITSGCLVDPAIANQIGGFREDYFIDQVDHEFCLRMRAHGHAVIITSKVIMEHSVGETEGPWLPFLNTLPSHPAMRKYYITRNSLITIAQYWRTEPVWCLYRSCRLILGLALMAVMETDRARKIKAFFLGCADALRKDMGPCKWKELEQ